MSQGYQYTAAAAQAPFVWNCKIKVIAKPLCSGLQQVLRAFCADTAGLLQCLRESGPDVSCCGAASPLLPKYCPGTVLLCKWMHPWCFWQLQRVICGINLCDTVTLLTDNGSIEHVQCILSVCEQGFEPCAYPVQPFFSV